VLVGIVLNLCGPVHAQQKAPSASPGDTDKALEKYRDMLNADPFTNPALLWVDRGETLWKSPRGPNNVPLEGCDLGKGAGITRGAYAELPRYFADADRVMDLESRLLRCLEKVQGFDPKAVLRNKFSPQGAAGEQMSDLEALTAYVATQSNGAKLAPQLAHPREQKAYQLGEALFFRRMGPWDFACATCHGEPGKRIRLQELPYFGDRKQAQSVMGSWPAYRVSQESLRTMQHRLYDCFWQMRLPAVDYGSEVTVALTMYLAKQGEGATLQVPTVKR